MRVENHLPASFSSAGGLCAEMQKEVEIYGISPEAVKNTWNHELRHFFADASRTEKGGEFGYQLQIGLSDGLIMAGWIAYYSPFGEREPEEMVAIAKAPGFSEMSDQDWNVYNASFRDWADKMREERAAAQNEPGNLDDLSDNDGLDAPKVPALIAIPRKDNEEETKYDKRARLIEQFGKIIDELIIEGEIPPLSEIIKGNVSEFLDCHQKELDWAYEEARKFANELPVEDEAPLANASGILLAQASFSSRFAGAKSSEAKNSSHSSTSSRSWFSAKEDKLDGNDEGGEVSTLPINVYVSPFEYSELPLAV